MSKLIAIKRDYAAGSDFCDDAADADTYSSPENVEKLHKFALAAAGKSTFSAAFDITELQNIVVLSTCSYEYKGAGYVIIADMKPV